MRLDAWQFKRIILQNYVLTFMHLAPAHDVATLSTRPHQ